MQQCGLSSTDTSSRSPDGSSARRPPEARIGDTLAVSLDISLNGMRSKRDSETVSDIATRWACRWARRHIVPLGYRLDGSSAEVYPGETYRQWWFGSVDVYLYRVRSVVRP